MVLRALHLKVTAHGLTDTGLTRQNNEDEWGELENAPLWVIADGMGGHQAGEVAAREAVAAFLRTSNEQLQMLSQNPHFLLEQEDAQRIFAKAFAVANEHVYSLGQAHEALRGMGTTLSALFLTEHFAFIGNVGDSRIYRLRDNVLEQLTEDHSLLRELVALGKLSEQEAEDFLYKNIITKAIGTEQTVEPTYNAQALATGDIFLLCSDGLSDLVSLSDLQTMLARPWTVEEKARSLIAIAKQRGGYDNITVVIVQLLAEGGE